MAFGQGELEDAPVQEVVDQESPQRDGVEDDFLKARAFVLTAVDDVGLDRPQDVHDDGGHQQGHQHQDVGVAHLPPSELI